MRLTFTGLERWAPGVGESLAGRAITARGEAWAARLPKSSADLWPMLEAMAGSDLLELLAHCASLSVNGVRDVHDRRPGGWAHVETLATAVGLDMTATWTATAESYFSRVAKAGILAAVAEGVGPEAAGRIAALKKTEMAEAAEDLVAGSGWLPPLLRTAGSASDADETSSVESEPDQEAYAFAVE